LTLSRLIRLALAVLFVASTTLSVVASAHAACEENTGVTDPSAHSHAASASSSHHDETGKDDGGAMDDAGGAAGTTCHGNAGCPGCVSPTASALPSLSVTPIAFRPTAESGQSAEPDTQLRPPKAS
jgi:hypothetical protein